MQKLLKISQQTFWQIIVKIATSGSGFIILGIISRSFGESGTGDFTLALAYLAFFYTLSDFGFNAHVIKKFQITNDKLQIEWRKLLGTRILWSFFLTTIALLLVLSLPSSFSNAFKLAVLWGGAIIIFFAVNITSQAIFQVKRRYDLDIPPTIIGVLVSVATIYYLSSIGVPVYLCILGYVLAWFIHAGGTTLLVRKLTQISPIFDLKYARTLFLSAWPIAGTLLLNSVYFKIDSFLLNIYHSSSIVGVYNLAFQIFQSLLVFPIFIMNAYYPLMLESLKEAKRFKYQIKTAAMLLMSLSIVGTTATYLLSPFAISVITGSGFAGSVVSLQILSFGFPAFFLTALLMWVMIAKNMYKSLLLVYALGLIFNLVTNLIFIPQYGYIAASWITVISEYLILALQIVVLWRR